MTLSISLVDCHNYTDRFVSASQMLRKPLYVSVATLAASPSV